MMSSCSSISGQLARILFLELKSPTDNGVIFKIDFKHRFRNPYVIPRLALGIRDWHLLSTIEIREPKTSGRENMNDTEDFDKITRARFDTDEQRTSNNKKELGLVMGEKQADNLNAQKLKMIDKIEQNPIIAICGVQQSVKRRIHQKRIP